MSLAIFGRTHEQDQGKLEISAEADSMFLANIPDIIEWNIFIDRDIVPPG
jgi:hypothetical protein